MRIKCAGCSSTFDSPLQNPGKVEYQKCSNVFKVQYRFKCPCPHCKAILVLHPGETETLIGSPMDSSKLDQADQEAEKTELFLVPKEDKPSESPSASASEPADDGPATCLRIDEKSLAPQTQVTQTKTVAQAIRIKVNKNSNSEQETKVKPFKIGAAVKRKSSKLRLGGERILKHKGNLFQAMVIGAIFIGGLAASSLALSIFKNETIPNLVQESEFQETVPSPSLPSENPKVENPGLPSNSEESLPLASGGLTQDIIKDEDSISFKEPSGDISRYQNKILNLPPLSKMSSGYGIRLDPFSHKLAFHSGLDFAAPIGTPVHAAINGIVKFAGHKGRYGKVVIIKHASGFETRYGHLSKFSVKKGQVVERGQRIAEVGNTGRSTGPHLHFELLKNGKKVNPLTIKLKSKSKS